MAGKTRHLRTRRRNPGRAATEKEIQDFTLLRADYKANRRRFVYEYIKDFNGADAIRRLGYQCKRPNVKAADFLAEPYTQHLLWDLVAKADEKAIVTRNEVLFGLKKEANHSGPDGHSSSRIAAWGKLAKILGMEITKIEGNMTHSGGVMAVPFSGSLADWEKASKLAQAKLKTEVKK